jgi:putative tricarboxylic transport membrane protein
MTHQNEPPSEDVPAPATHGRAPGETLFALSMLMGAAVLLHQAWSIAGFSSFSSAGVFPMLAAGTMVASGIAVAVQTARKTCADEGSALRNFAFDVVGPKVLFIGALITAYLFLLEPLGFVTSSALFLSVAICGLHRRNYAGMIALSLATVAVIYLLFRYVFIVILPQGVLI